MCLIVCSIVPLDPSTPLDAYSLANHRRTGSEGMKPIHTSLNCQVSEVIKVCGKRAVKNLKPVKLIY